MKSIRDIDVSNKRVLVRADFNVSLDEQGNILDDFRIRATIPTIEYLLEKNAKVILMSHLGKSGSKIKAVDKAAKPAEILSPGKPDGSVVAALRLNPVQDRLMEYLDVSIVKASDCVGEEIEKWTYQMQPGEILLLENLRFHKEEEANDINFAKKLACLGDLYVNDAFAVCHREHASVAAITKFLPSYSGLLLEKEIESLSKTIENPKRPLVVIIGGAKISTKIKLIRRFLEFADNVLIGGALANTVLHAKGIAIGKSVIEEGMVEDVKDLVITNTKLHIPVDTIVASNISGRDNIREAPVGKTEKDELILDIGPETEILYSRIIQTAKTVVWNGPMGLCEREAFAHGTKTIAEAIASCGCYSVVGGGETIALINNLDLLNKFSHVSTGGGAMLKFLAGEELPAIAALET